MDTQSTVSTSFAGADRITRLEESQTLAMARRVRELKAQGRKMFSFTLGEPDFDTPTHIREAAIAAIREGDTHYPPVAGLPALREAAAAFFREQYGLTTTAAQVVVSTGAKQSLINAMMCLLNPGDEIIIPAPYWVSYLPMALMCDAQPVLVQPSGDALTITAEQLEAAITPRTRVFLLNSPGNPSGMMYAPDALAELADVLARHPQVFIISDEIYSLITFGTPHISFGTLRNLEARTVTINGVSKAFAMTGWRIGLMAAPDWLAKLCEKYQGQITSGACSIAQRAALAALTSDLTPTHEMAARFRQRRDLALRLFAEKMPAARLAPPDGAFYLFPDISAYLGKKTPAGQVIYDADDLTMYLLDEACVAVVSGVAFGSARHIRLSYACGEDNITGGLAAMAESLARLV